LSLPQVDFHSGVGAPVHFACRLLRKAWRQGVAVLVTAPSATLAMLDRELWTFEAQEFVPHLRVRPGQSVDAAMRRTPIWLCEGEPPGPCPRVLVNLGADLPHGGEPFDRIIEIVPSDGEERQRARARWRAYEAQGWTIRHHPQSAA
jgi:DNA polymerase III subunit chi